MTAVAPPLLVVERIGKTFGGVIALRDVSFTVASREADDRPLGQPHVTTVRRRLRR